MASNVELTADERAKIETNRKSPRPQYFDATAAKDQQISEDFESFLILQDAEVITETLTWLATSGTLAEMRIDRNAVAFEALIADMDDRSAKQDEINDIADSFNQWKAAFNAGKFSDVTEVGLIIRDMQSTAEEVFVFQERMDHLERMHARIADRIRQGVSTAQLQELLSWPTPLLAY